MSSLEGEERDKGDCEYISVRARDEDGYLQSRRHLVETSNTQGGYQLIKEPRSSRWLL